MYASNAKSTRLKSWIVHLLASQVPWSQYVVVAKNIVIVLMLVP